MPSMFNEENPCGSSDWSQLLFFKKKQMWLQLHAVSLTDYVKVNRISRGLCMNKPPAMFNEDEAFKLKWAAVLDKCFYSLHLWKPIYQSVEMSVKIRLFNQWKYISSSKMLVEILLLML